MPALGRSTRSEQGAVALQPGWLTAQELVSWHLHHVGACAAAMFQMGTPAWAPAVASPNGDKGVAVWDHSVRFGTRLLTQPRCWRALIAAAGLWTF